MLTADQVIAHINGYMRSVPGKRNSDWYVGIASNWRDRLFADHAVSEVNGNWAYAQAINSETARAVEQRYLVAGCDGGPGGGDFTTVYVYAYVKTYSTNP